MDTIYVSFTEFMEKHAPILLGFTREDVLRMGEQAQKERKDFFFQVKDRLITIPLLSLDEWFAPPVAPVEVEKPRSQPKLPKI